ncbi:MFS transporter [Streptosporangium sandarakinum]|uniref:MFS transporter n=1 Tax=Streptosporangium sandarakinum TaxID=1260955 RepID=UPI003799E4F5
MTGSSTRNTASRRMRQLLGRLAAQVGGSARLQVIAILACVLALDAADKGTIGAVTPDLRQDLGIDDTGIGALVAVSSGASALAAIPVGRLTDRVNRVRLPAGSILLWSMAMAISALADSFQVLLFSRMAMGAVTATTGPTLASLVGDYFPLSERGRMYGFILAGEMLGSGLGLIVLGDLASWTSWRTSFWVLALIGLGLLYVVARRLPEPERGGGSRTRTAGERHERREHDGGEAGTTGEEPPRRNDLVYETIRRRAIEPQTALILKHDPARMSLRQAVVYVLRVPTNRIMIIASAVGYFFFSGLRTFTVEFVTRHYGLSRVAVSGLIPIIGIGALAGVLSAGPLSDRLTERGHLSGRVRMPAAAYIVSAALFLPAITTTTVAMAIPLYTAAAFCLAATNPPLDAARLDVMHFRLWGRAESVRTFLRMSSEASAPVLFGAVADALGGGAGRADGLKYTFLIMLVPLVANGLILFTAGRTYPRDVATAVASEARTRGAGERRDS